jgi:hypothetical protein
MAMLATFQIDSTDGANAKLDVKAIYYLWVHKNIVFKHFCKNIKYSGVFLNFLTLLFLFYLTIWIYAFNTEYYLSYINMYLVTQ